MATAGTTQTSTRSAVGRLLREWRKRRRHSQLELALLANVSARHLGFLETGRAHPSRDMVLRLAEHLDVPLRERNAMLLAAGFAPEYSAQDLEAPGMVAVRAAIDLVLEAHHPYPAVAVDRYWNIIAANPAAAVFSEGVAERLLTPEPNVYRISLHPAGMANRIRNFAEYAPPHLLAQLRQDLATTADPQLGELLEEVESYSTTKRLTRPRSPQRPVVVPLRFSHPQGELSLFTTIATFGTPADVTVSELAIESFFPADSETASLLQQIAVHQTVNAITAQNTSGDRAPTRRVTKVQPRMTTEIYEAAVVVLQAPTRCATRHADARPRS